MYWYLMVGRSGHRRSCSVGLVVGDEEACCCVQILIDLLHRQVNDLLKDLYSYSHSLFPTKTRRNLKQSLEPNRREISPWAFCKPLRSKYYKHHSQRFKIPLPTQGSSLIPKSELLRP